MWQRCNCIDWIPWLYLPSVCIWKIQFASLFLSTSIHMQYGKINEIYMRETVPIFKKIACVVYGISRRSQLVLPVISYIELVVFLHTIIEYEHWWQDENISFFVFFSPSWDAFCNTINNFVPNDTLARNDVSRSLLAEEVWRQSISRSLRDGEAHYVKNNGKNKFKSKSSGCGARDCSNSDSTN